MGKRTAAILAAAMILAAALAGCGQEDGQLETMGQLEEYSAYDVSGQAEEIPDTEDVTESSFAYVGGSGYGYLDMYEVTACGASIDVYLPGSEAYSPAAGKAESSMHGVSMSYELIENGETYQALSAASQDKRAGLAATDGISDLQEQDVISGDGWAMQELDCRVGSGDDAPLICAYVKADDIGSGFVIVSCVTVDWSAEDQCTETVLNEAADAVGIELNNEADTEESTRTTEAVG